MKAQKNIIVKVKVMTIEGRYCLEEIHGLKEGVVLSGVLNENGESVSIVFNGEPCVLSLGHNCTEVKQNAKRHVRRLPAGCSLDWSCVVEDHLGHSGFGETRREAVEDMLDNGGERVGVRTTWVVRDWDSKQEVHGWLYGEGDTKEEALEAFHEMYDEYK